MASTSAARSIVRRILARERLEAVEAKVRELSSAQAGATSAERHDAARLARVTGEWRSELDDLRASLDAVRGEVRALASMVETLHHTVVTADPELTRSLVDTVRDDVERLARRVNLVQGYTEGSA